MAGPAKYVTLNARPMANGDPGVRMNATVSMEVFATHSLVSVNGKFCE